MAEYESGTCNIDEKEVRLRYYSSWVMSLVVAGFIGLIFYYPMSGIDAYMFASLFFIGISASMMYLQYSNRFCTGLALRGKQKTGDEAEKVEDPEKVRKDRKKAVLIFGQSIAFSAVLTGLVYLTVTSVGFLPILG